MKIFFIAIGCFICGQISYRMFHECDYESHESISVKKLRNDNRQMDSLLQLWIGDHSWRIRVMAGMETDTVITNYQKWKKKETKRLLDILDKH